jgi:hypothetical protein
MHNRFGTCRQTISESAWPARTNPAERCISLAARRAELPSTESVAGKHQVGKRHLERSGPIPMLEIARDWFWASHRHGRHFPLPWAEPGAGVRLSNNLQHVCHSPGVGLPGHIVLPRLTPLDRFLPTYLPRQSSLQSASRVCFIMSEEVRFRRRLVLAEE